MQQLRPYALFAGLSAILGHVAFVQLEAVGDGRFWAWVKITVVFVVAYLLMKNHHLDKRCTSPNWVLAAFGIIGTLGTLILLTQLGKWFLIGVTILFLPIAWTGFYVLMPYLHFSLLFLLLTIANDLRYAHEIDK